jgi:glycerol transport system ATP-binding protein
MAPADGALAGLPDGRFTAGFRANHLHVARPDRPALTFPAQVLVTEITGSESFIHLSCGGARWIALTHGVRDMAPGLEMNVFVEPRHLYLFDGDGRLAAAAPYAQAA